MKRSTRFLIVGVLGLMLLSMAGLPFIMMTLANPKPLPSSAPGGKGNGVYVQDANGCFKLFPRAGASADWPEDAFATEPQARVYVKARQYDDLVAYGAYAFPSGRPVTVAKEMVAGRMLCLTPSHALQPGKYVVKISRDDAWGGSDFYFLSVRR